MNRLILIAAALVLTPAAFAADTAPAAAEAVPASTCTRPQVQLDAAGKIKDGKALQAQANAFQSCTDAYVAERKKAVDQHEAAAKANRDAGNAAVKEFNDFAAEITAAQQPKK